MKNLKNAVTKNAKAILILSLVLCSLQPATQSVVYCSEQDLSHPNIYEEINDVDTESHDFDETLENEDGVNPEISIDPNVSGEFEMTTEPESSPESVINSQDKSFLTEEIDYRENYSIEFLAAGIETSGTCGPDARWTLNAAGTLTVSGTGEMKGYATGLNQTFNDSNPPPWYDYKDNINKIIINRGITSIGDYAFYNCNNLIEVSLPDGLTDIGNYSFGNTQCKLRSIHIPSSVKDIGQYAFRSVTEVYITDADAWCHFSFGNWMGKSPFANEWNLYLNNQPLTEATIPSDITAIGGHLFDGCLSIRKVKINGTIESIGDYAFAGCVNLTDIELPNGLTNIGMAAFSGSGLTKINIPSSVKEVQTYAFSCENLREVYISDLEAWCDISFSYDTNPLSNKANLYLNGQLVTELVIPQSVSELKGNAFNGCASIKKVTINGNVQSIGSSAFSECINLEIVEIGEGVKTISSGAFEDCVSLQTINMPNTLTDIQSSAFRNCKALPSIDIPADVTEIGEQAFRECSSLTNINVSAYNNTFSSDDGVLYDKDKTELLVCPVGKTGTYKIVDGVTTIHDNACYYGNIKNIIIPNTVEVIENYAFGYCINMTDLDIPASVTSIGDSAFYHCINLTSLSLHNGLREIGGFAFGYCINLKSVNIPDSVNKLGNRPFQNCDNITTIVLGNGITDIPYGAFEYCCSLENIEIRGAVTNIDSGAFRGCSSLKRFDIPSGVTEIKSNVFQECKNLTNIVIGSNITSIGNYAFSECVSIPEIKIPQSVTNIGDGAFQSCGSLKQIDVDPLNESYSSLDGVLYNIDKTVLVTSPGGKTGTLTVPATVEKIETIGSKLSDIKVESGNRSYISENGVLYNIEMTKLICYPGERGGEYVVPETVTDISNLSSYQMTELTFLNADNVTDGISGRSLSNCLALTDINVLSGSKYCSVDGVLYNKDKTELVAFPAGREGEYTILEGVKTVANAAFLGRKISKINLPLGIKELDYYSFADCDLLEAVIMPDSITYIGGYAFSGCENLKDVKISNGIETLDMNVFYGTGIEMIEIPGSVTKIEQSAFSHCNNLISIILPASVSYVGQWAFSEDLLLTDIYYIGTREQWNKIEIVDNDNEFLINANKHFNYNISVSETAVQNGIITVSTNLDNLIEPDAETKSEIFVVLYDENDVVLDNYTAKYDGTDIIGKLKNNEKADHIKVFVWNKDGSLEPIAGAAEYISLNMN